MNFDPFWHLVFLPLLLLLLSAALGDRERTASCFLCSITCAILLSGWCSLRVNRRHLVLAAELDAAHIESFLKYWQKSDMKDCFYYCSERHNVGVLFGTLKVQSFMLTEVRDCDLLIVVTSSTFLKRKDMFKTKSSYHQNPQPSIYIDKYILYTYTVYMYTAL